MNANVKDDNSKRNERGEDGEWRVLKRELFSRCRFC